MTNEAGTPPNQPGAEGAPTMQRPNRPPPRMWSLTVTDVEDLTPHMRRVRFTGDELETYEYRPGQDINIYFPGAGPEGQTVRRHYTVRTFDREARRLAVDFLRHGDGPGARFAETVQVGDDLEVSGPANRYTPNLEANWHILAGDETAIPAIFGTLESLPAGTKVKAFIEIESADEEQAVDTEADLDLIWLHRGGTPGEESRLLFETITSKPLPDGKGHVFLAGETNRMRELRKALLETGLDREQIFAMGYWRPGRFGGDETIRD